MYIFNHLSSNLLGSRSLPYGDLKFWYSFKTQYYSIACCTRLPRWQDRRYRASRELCSNSLLVVDEGVYFLRPMTHFPRQLHVPYSSISFLPLFLFYPLFNYVLQSVAYI